MTRKRDLKKRIRARMRSTGERYTAARRQVLDAAERPGPVPVTELRDVSELAAAVGLRCHVVISSALADRLEARQVLERIRGALAATGADPETELLRACALRGERPEGLSAGTMHPLIALRRPELRRLLARAAAGIGGVSESGHLLALHVADVPVLCLLTCRPARASAPRGPCLLLDTLGGLAPDAVPSLWR